MDFEATTTVTAPGGTATRNPTTNEERIISNNFPALLSLLMNYRSFFRTLLKGPDIPFCKFTSLFGSKYHKNR